VSAVLLVLGVLVAAAGTTLVAGAGAVSRLALARWVSQRQHGSAVAAALLSAPARIVGPAQGLVAGGMVLAGMGTAGLVAPLTPLSAGAVLIVGVPALLAAAYALPRAIGHRWPEPLVRAAAPSLERLGRVSRALLPAGRDPEIEGVRRGTDTVGEDEIVVLAGVLSFTDRTVREVMTPRPDIVAIEESASARDAAVLLTESGYSRLPVFRDSLDQIIGMAYVFDLLKVGMTDRLPLRPVLAIPASRRCADLLFEMQRERRHLAVVLDEFGGTAGIVTLDDLLEELVGEIFDEGDGVATDAGETELLDVDGALGVQEIADRFGVTLPGGRETLGGMLATALGRIPRIGERVVMGQLEFDVVHASATRVERVIVRRADAASVTVIGS
jgi:magnesium and cobalt exporter, CNNM family